ncbi:VOC family protein [Mycobacterium yunnanensis]|uniref:VOC family protein n=1 Tax=Mycobacterium yunnanensis TaxID=368477 RepID=A0A9X2Z564_9MYCO|nr:VOC family protein [Mycobacterium yunnanensis]MCV7422694.1 VOC family protein [Mycobacterium yunnanensis]
MIGSLRSVVLDTRDPSGLASFYQAVLGGDVDAGDGTFVVLTNSTGRRLAFQLAPEHEPPRFPDPRGSQQFHLDIEVADVDEAEPKVLAHGASRVGDGVDGGDVRVYRDPAGHTFCLVW